MRLNIRDHAVQQRLLAVARGRSNRELAAAINVKHATLIRWLRRHKDFRQTIRTAQKNELFR